MKLLLEMRKKQIIIKKAKREGNNREVPYPYFLSKRPNHVKNHDWKWEREEPILAKFIYLGIFGPRDIALLIHSIIILQKEPFYKAPAYMFDDQSKSGVVINSKLKEWWIIIIIFFFMDFANKAIFNEKQNIF